MEGDRPQPGRLAAIAQWATEPPVFPLTTGLSFAAIAFLFSNDWQDISASVPLAIPFFVVGLGLGFHLRRAMVQILGTGRLSGKSAWVLIGVGLAWMLVLAVNIVYKIITSF